MRTRVLPRTQLRAGLLLAVTLTACGRTMNSSLTGTSPSAVPDVFECVKNQLKALGYSQTSIDAEANRIAAKKYDETVRRPDTQFRRMVDRLEIEIAPGAEGAVTTLEVTARTFAELTTQRGPTEQQERTSVQADSAAQAVVQQCGR
ncbi:MAG TPA: hypothetical protein VMY76_11485 [Gemmatimonadales bacterium]|nr:hypothetical protein [Gemmatimonadales bacterium]